jgi:uncharacterized protein (TIGR02757 family)
VEHFDLKSFLDERASRYENSEFLASDPIQLPHRFSKKEDIEIVAFLVSTIAWGNRTSIIKSGERLVDIMENDPFRFVMAYSERPLNFVHRTFNGEDLNAFFVALKRIYETYDSLENAFVIDDPEANMFKRIVHFREIFTQAPFPERTQKHLANPLKGSSAKRINMFMRWMVRPAELGVDFGLWRQVPLSELRIPLDVHTGNVARKLGLLTRKQNDWKALDEIHSHLDACDPYDPCKYDYALFGLGVFERF